MSLPEGTVTFLLTDVVGSTRLWATHREAMADAIGLHQEIVAKSVEANGGHLIKARGEGDATFSVFTRAADAARAAADLQRALGTQVWPDGLEIRVRAALHTGEADMRDGDYLGPSVNRAARLRSIGHGGQTLLSQATAGILQDSLPRSCRLVSLGPHTLKDFAQPESVYELCVEDLPASFPPLRATMMERADAAPDVRVSDADRQHTVDLLRHHCTEGYITLEEFSQRIEVVYAAHVRSELDLVLSDLPMARAAAHPVTATPVRSRKRTKWTIAVMSGFSRRDRWRVEDRTRCVAIMGGSEIDLRQAEISGDHIEITAFALMGGIEIIVPEGVDVELTGLAFMGAKDVKVKEGPVRPGMPLITVKAVAIMGGVSVKSKPPPERERELREERRRLRQERKARREVGKGREL